MHEGAFVSADEAAALLGVKLTTLYAYASRGLVKSRGPSRTEGHFYDRADLERLLARSRARKGHTAVAASALRWGEPVLDSAITAIDERGPRFRGQLATELVRAGRTFEQVAELLWTGKLPAVTPRWREGASVTIRAVPGRPLSTLFGVLSRAAAEEAFEPLEKNAELERARAILLRLARHLGPRVVRSGASVAATVARALGLTDSAEVTQAIDAALVLLADHELNVSSFATRVTASAGSGLAASWLAGFAALTGARHGGASSIVEAWVRDVGSAARVPRALARMTARGDAIEGFRHTLYPAGDPRAAPLLELARTLGRRNAQVRVIDAAILQLAPRGGRPNVDVGLAALSAALGAPAGTGTLLFAVGRSAGWVAHILEQREAGPLLRPRARYVGV
jgi:citrate synthase